MTETNKTQVVNGWTPPLVREGWDRSRIATQQDIDRLERIASHYYEMKRLVEELHGICISVENGTQDGAR